MNRLLSVPGGQAALARTFRLRLDRAAARRILSRLRQSELLEPLLNTRRRKAAGQRHERRHLDRFAIRMPIMVSPAQFEGETIRLRDEPPIAAVTRNVSLRGVGFAHDELLAGDYALVTFDLLGEPISLLVEIRWKNHPGDRNWASGGMYLAIAEPVE